MNVSSEPSPLSWRKSSYSDGHGGDCVEVADGFDDVLPVRDSKTPNRPVLTFAHSPWNTFVAALRAGTVR